ncbi:MAG: hypothetical protein AYK18_07120 [Theionarchaea archaeon DG-70]|nr:MAG: hypothetical protein AYK18_07120 [Theionarchaea archaeon DG-70]
MKCEVTVLEFRKNMVVKGYSKRTVGNYISIIERFIDFLQKDLKDVTIEDIKRFFLYLRDDNCSESTIRTYLSILKTFLLFIEGEDVANEIILPKVEKKLPIVLTVEEIRKLLENIENIRDLVVVRLLYASGLRVSELVNLDRESIEGNKIIVRSGKGKKDRIVLIDDGTSKLLKRYLEKRKDKDKALFVSNRGERLGTRSIQNLVKKYAEKTGIKKNVTPHTLRHTFATHLLQNKANIMVIKDLLGHENISTTQIYTHVTDAHREETYEDAHPLSISG